MNKIKDYINTLFSKTPGIDYIPPELSGVLFYTRSEMEKKAKAYDDISKVDYWVNVYRVYNFINNFLDEQLKDFKIVFDPNEYPVLSEAVSLLNGGKNNNTIDYEVIENARKIRFYGIFNFIPPIHKLLDSEVKVDFDKIEKETGIKIDEKIKKDFDFNYEKFVDISKIVEKEIPPHLKDCFNKECLKKLSLEKQPDFMGVAAQNIKGFYEYVGKYNQLTVAKMAWKVILVFLLRLWITYLKVVGKILPLFKPVTKAVGKWFTKKLHKLEKEVFGKKVTSDIECPHYETWYKLKWIHRWQRKPWFIVTKTKRINICKERFDPDTGEVEPLPEDLPEDFGGEVNFNINRISENVNPLTCMNAAQEVQNFLSRYDPVTIKAEKSYGITKRYLLDIKEQLFNIENAMLLSLYHDLLHFETPEGRMAARERLFPLLTSQVRYGTRGIFEEALRLSNYSQEIKRASDIFENKASGMYRETEVFVSKVKVDIYNFLSELLIIIYNWLNSSAPICCLLVFMFQGEEVHATIKPKLYLEKFLRLLRSVLVYIKADHEDGLGYINLASIVDTVITFILSFAIMGIITVIRLAMRFVLNDVFKEFNDILTKLPKAAKVCLPLYQIFDLIKRHVDYIVENSNTMLSEIFMKLEKSLKNSLKFSRLLNIRIEASKWILAIDEFLDALELTDVWELINYCVNLYGDAFDSGDEKISTEVGKIQLHKELPIEKQVEAILVEIEETKLSSKLLEDLTGKSLYIGKKHVSYYIDYAKKLGITPKHMVEILYGNNYREVLNKYADIKKGEKEVRSDIFTEVRLPNETTVKQKMLKFASCNKRYNRDNLFSVIVKNITKYVP